MSRHHLDRRRLPGLAWARAKRVAKDRAGWRCERCGSPIELEVHHRQALDKGGDPLALDNLQVLCREHHLSEHLDPQRRRWRAFVRELQHDDD